LITRSEEGMSFIGEEIIHKKIEASQVYDVTGAGDTCISIFSILHFLKKPIRESLDWTLAAAKVTISQLGSYAPTVQDIREQLFFSEKKDIFAENEIERLLPLLKDKKVVFTNGCFDLIHRGHVKYLKESRKKGDVLIVGLNTDRSVRALKGDSRPFIDEESRAFVLSNLSCVDYVVLFDQDTPLEIIKKIRPAVLTKGKDYEKKEVVGKDFVESYGGKVELIPLEEDCSTTAIARRIKERL
jgi:D-beta-D-heptose 7-phosphate kinase/D-beta-D-heptose 1-phosphate adenosyltransferase